MLKVAVPKEKIAKFCQKHHIRRLSLFGSVLRDDFRPDSDIDVLVEFEPGQPVTFFDLYDMEMELSKLLNDRKIDLVTVKALNHRIRDQFWLMPRCNMPKDELV